VGGTSKGLLFPLHGADLVNAAVMARPCGAGPSRRCGLSRNPLDVMAQVILSMDRHGDLDIERPLRVPQDEHALP